ncbi:DUF6023 family protein [Actinoplanes italicus]|uniref:Uncharacterized protein n=1 Tax=Actinoplanes italicus TaxID=113567 RepID=A0A2T0KAM6_9ACTN|nr:DUF6023 family protein [Actinoplanes italicus]PRX20231.1 hypothetical protein CLV67_10825 [Actinoplanes italicus]
MSVERGHGAVLHALAALILVIGVGWWWRAAPHPAVDRRLVDWRQSAEQLLPDIGDHEMSNTLALEAEAGHEEVVDVEQGEFLISVVCAGSDGSRVRVSLGEGSGRGLRCSGSRTPETFTVTLVNELRLKVSVESTGPVVFRYALQRSNG